MQLVNEKRTERREGPETPVNLEVTAAAAAVVVG
jgi:hypothetical protein